MIGKFVIGKLNRTLGKGRKIIVAAGLAAGLLAAAACEVQDSVDPGVQLSKYYNCTRLADLAIDLVEEQESTLRILKISDLRMIQNSFNRVECRGTARWNRGSAENISVYAERDSDGDVFYGYRSE